MDRIAIVVKDGMVRSVHTSIDNVNILVFDLDLDSYSETRLEGGKKRATKIESLEKLRAIM
jgi:hypothetical protein